MGYVLREGRFNKRIYEFIADNFKVNSEIMERLHNRGYDFSFLEVFEGDKFLTILPYYQLNRPIKSDHLQTKVYITKCRVGNVFDFHYCRNRLVQNIWNR